MSVVESASFSTWHKKGGSDRFFLACIINSRTFLFFSTHTLPCCSKFRETVFFIWSVKVSHDILTCGKTLLPSSTVLCTCLNCKHEFYQAELLCRLFMEGCRREWISLLLLLKPIRSTFLLKSYLLVIVRLCSRDVQLFPSKCLRLCFVTLFLVLSQLLRYSFLRFFQVF